MCRFLIACWGSPSSPKEMVWANHFPKYFPSAAAADGDAETKPSGKEVEVADIGCGFGGLIVSLAQKLPDTLMLGIYAQRSPIRAW